MNASARLAQFVTTNPELIGRVVDFNAPTDRLIKFDFTANNTELTTEIINDTAVFSQWVQQKLQSGNYKYGVGGYMEHRTLYARSPLFDNTDEPRRLHLGVDIWAEAGTPVYSPLDGVVHSFKNNNNFGDYGPTLILQHNLNGLILYSLYGHLSLKSLEDRSVGQTIYRDQQIGEFGNNYENGNWPPHLHFQLMFDMEGNIGDYPGVARLSEKEKHLKNIPDPNIILRFPA